MLKNCGPFFFRDSRSNTVTLHVQLYIPSSNTSPLCSSYPHLQSWGRNWDTTCHVHRSYWRRRTEECARFGRGDGQLCVPVHTPDHRQGSTHRQVLVLSVSWLSHCEQQLVVRECIGRTIPTSWTVPHQGQKLWETVQLLSYQVSVLWRFMVLDC